MKAIYLCAAFVGIFVYVISVSAAMTSTNFQILWDSVNAGGLDTSSSATYQLRDVVGDVSVGTGSSANYQTSDGYRSGIFDQTISFALFSQDASTSRAATALSGTTITADTTNLAENDYVVLIQDEGSGQVSAIGKISSIGVGQIVVDELKTAGSSPSIDGTNDVLYKLSGTTGAIGSLSSTTVNTTTIGFEVTADLTNGYTLKTYDDGNLRFGSYDIDDVSDGEVTVGSEEYGGRSSDTSLASSTFDTQDTAFTTSLQDVVTVSSNAFEDRNFVTLKSSMSPTSTAATYTHTLGFILSGNF